MEFRSILYQNALYQNAEPATTLHQDAEPAARSEPPDCFHDLNLDQVIDSVLDGKQEYELKPYYYTPLTDRQEVIYRQEVMKEMRSEDLFAAIKSFAAAMKRMREALRRYEKVYYQHQKEFYFLEAVETYCDAVRNLSADLSERELTSEGFLGFRQSLEEYASSEAFLSIFEEEKGIKARLDSIRYNMLIRGGCIKVSHYEGENNYSVEIEKTFEKFRQGAVKSFLRKEPDGYDMNHVEAAVLDNVVRLNPEVFREVGAFCGRRKDFADRLVTAFDREIQFYVSFLEYAARFQGRGLPFCFPEIGASKEIYDRGGFDLALANYLIRDDRQVVCNDFYLKEPERIFIVTGPNQGGKTTFARTFGQLHYLAGIGCMVPGTEARLFLPDRIYCHFEREEAAVAHRGKLKDDLVRIYDILEEATPDSILIINEIFSSATLKDAVYLGKKIIDRIAALDSLCVCVTFLDELASCSDKIVSLSSTVLQEDISSRTYKIVRKPADGLAYAISIAEKYRLTYESLKERIQA